MTRLGKIWTSKNIRKETKACLVMTMVLTIINEVAQRLGLIGKRSVGKLTLLKYGAGAKCCEFNKLLGEQTK